MYFPLVYITLRVEQQPIQNFFLFSLFLLLFCIFLIKHFIQKIEVFCFMKFNFAACLVFRAIKINSWWWSKTNHQYMFFSWETFFHLRESIFQVRLSIGEADNSIWFRFIPAQMHSLEKSLKIDDLLLRQIFPHLITMQYRFNDIAAAFQEALIIQKGLACRIFFFRLFWALLKKGQKIQIYHFTYRLKAFWNPSDN